MKVKALKKAYALALLHGADQFEFDGHELLTAYAKYLLEYLALVFGKS
jgi:hypothetical protein